MKNLRLYLIFIFIFLKMPNAIAQTPNLLFSGTWYGTPNALVPERMVEKLWFENNQLNYELRESPDALPQKFTLQIAKIIPQGNNPYGVLLVKCIKSEDNQEEYFTCFLYRNKQDDQIEFTKFFLGVGLLVNKSTLAELEREIKNQDDDRNLLDEIAKIGWQIFLSPSAYQAMLALPDFPLNDKTAYIKMEQAVLDEIKKLINQFPKKEIDPEYANEIMMKINFFKLVKEQGYNCSPASLMKFQKTVEFLYEKKDKDYLRLLKEKEQILGNE